MFDHIVLVIELILLILIWLDGRTMRDSALRSEKLYESWFNERRSERTARQASAQKARDTKAQKAAMVSNSVDQSGVGSSVVRESDVGRPTNISSDGGNLGSEVRVSDPLVDK